VPISTPTAARRLRWRSATAWRGSARLIVGGADELVGLVARAAFNRVTGGAPDLA
jgi:hypothetical protein